MPATRRSRRVAGLPPTAVGLPPTIVSPPAPASHHGFRRTAARAASAPLATVATKKRPIDAVASHNPSANDSVPKRRRPSIDITKDSSNTPDEQLRRELAATTPSRQRGLPGTLFPPAPTPSPIVHLSVFSPIGQRLNDFISRIISLLKAADGIPKDETNLFQVFEAIATWKTKNQGKQLPNVAAIQRFLDDNNTITSPRRSLAVSDSDSNVAMAVKESESCSTFRAPSPNNPADWSSDEDENEATQAGEVDGYNTKTGGEATAVKEPTFSSTFRAPSPNNPADWSSDDDEYEDAPTSKADDYDMNTDEENDEDNDHITNTPCPKTGAKKFSRSRSSSLGNTTSLQAQSIFDTRGHSTTNSTVFTEATLAPAPLLQTPGSVSPHITYMPQRTPHARNVNKNDAHCEPSVAKTTIHSNFIHHILGNGVNINISITQQIVNDFNQRMHSAQNGLEKGLELEIAEEADLAAFDPAIKDFKAITQNAELEDASMDVDVLMDEDAVDGMDIDQDRTDFELEKLRLHPFRTIIDQVPEEEFEEL